MRMAAGVFSLAAIFFFHCFNCTGLGVTGTPSILTFVYSSVSFTELD